jgi:hypothetical protein
VSDATSPFDVGAADQLGVTASADAVGLARGMVQSGTLQVSGDGWTPLLIPLTLRTDPLAITVSPNPLTVRQGGEGTLTVAVQSFAPQDQQLTFSLHFGPDSEGLSMDPVTLSLPRGTTRSVNLHLRVGPSVPLGQRYLLLDGLFPLIEPVLQVVAAPVSVTLTGSTSFSAYPGETIDVPARLNLNATTTNTEIKFSPGDLPTRVTTNHRAPMINIADRSHLPPVEANLDATGSRADAIPLLVDPRAPVADNYPARINWSAYDGRQTGALALTLTIKKPRAGNVRHFVPETDAFRFNNSFPITDENAEQIRKRYRVAADIALGAGVQAVRSVLESLTVQVPPVVGPSVSLPGIVMDAVIGEVTNQIARPLIDHIAGQIPGTFGRCGGMAFSGYDFYLAGWPVDERLGTAPPATGPLGDYILSRLLDSLDLNAGTFVDWIINLHVLPVVSRAANIALGTAIGSIGGPIGAAFGALVGSQVNVFNLGGPKVILDRTKEEWGRIKTALNTEAAWPIGLVYGDSANPIDQHQVLACSCVDNGNGTGSLTIWDNNDANRSSTMALDFRGGELVITQWIGVDHSRRPLKGIFLEKYSPSRPPQSLRFPDRT